MPQMKPLKWMWLLISTILSIFFIQSIIFSIPNFNNYSKNLKINKYKYKIKW